MRAHPFRLATTDTRRVKGRHEIDTVDPFLVSAEHRAWSKAVLQRAGYRCQDANHDPAFPRNGVRLHADHITERRDGGGNSPENGIALCVRCHVAKTLRERAKRMGLRPSLGIA